MCNWCFHWSLFMHCVQDASLYGTLFKSRRNLSLSLFRSTFGEPCFPWRLFVQIKTDGLTRRFVSAVSVLSFLVSEILLFWKFRAPPFLFSQCRFPKKNRMGENEWSRSFFHLMLLFFPLPPLMSNIRWKKTPRGYCGRNRNQGKKLRAWFSNKYFANF